jgi:hypothetical protein
MRKQGLILLSIIGLVVLSSAALAAPILAAAPPTSTGEIEQLKKVKKGNVEKDNKVLDTDLEDSSPDSVELVGQGGNQTFTITTKTFLPPGKLLFKHFAAGVWVDVQTEPTGLTATEDAGNSEKKIKFTVTNMPTNAGEFPIKCEGNLTGGTGGTPPHWSAKVAKYKVDLDIDGLTGAAEDSPGAALVRNFDGNNAPRKKIILKAVEPDPGYGEKQVLTRANTKVKVFTASSGGTEITFSGGDNEFEASASTDLYVEGAEASQSMGDVTLKLALKKFPDIHDDVTFTVLWVQVASRHNNGQISADNNAVTAFDLYGVPPNHNLGVPILSATFNLPAGAGGSSYGLTSEFVGTVSPANFVPALFTATGAGPTELKLERYCLGGDDYWGPTGSENHVAKPAHPDTSPDDNRDDNPRSNSSVGKIYDLDAPGIPTLLAPPGGKCRTRVNYKEYATWAGVRCSNELPWYMRQSYVCQGIEEGQATGTGPQAVQDTTKNWLANQWVPGVLMVSTPPNVQFRHTRGSNVNTVFVTANFNPGIFPPVHYAIVLPTTWVPVNDVPGDNKNDDGNTNTTWNLQ